MNVGSATLASLLFWVLIQESQPTNYQRAMCGLDAKEIRTGQTAEQMLDRCLPTKRRTVGRFTLYVFELLPGFHNISVLAKDGRLQRAVEYSCTYTRTHFDALTSDDAREYAQLLQANQDRPFERYIGRWGWERPPEREWRGDEPEAKPQM